MYIISKNARPLMMHTSEMCFRNNFSEQTLNLFLMTTSLVHENKLLTRKETHVMAELNAQCDKKLQTNKIIQGNRINMNFYVVNLINNTLKNIFWGFST